MCELMGFLNLFVRGGGNHFHPNIGYEPNEELSKNYPEGKDVREHLYLYPSKSPNLSETMETSPSSSENE